MIEQLKLFEEDYRSLEELRKLITELHPTGGMNNDGTLQYTEYHLDFYRDLAFIVVYRDDVDNGERIIHDCVELIQVENNLYKILRIDGESLGTIENKKHLAIQKSIIESFENEELFKK